MPISFSKGQQSIAILWFIGGGLAMTILIAQSMAKTWGSWVSDAWSWLLPAILPTLTLIISTVVVESTQQRKSRTEVNSFAYYLCIGLSAFYLICVLTVLLSINFVQIKPLDLMKMSSLWLAPLQGLLSGIIGVFFVKQAGSRLKGKSKRRTLGDEQSDG
jgi:cytochrome c-type biogenesis protein CcmH/NrfF